MEDFKYSRVYRALSIVLVVLAALSLIPTLIFLYHVYQSVEPAEGTQTSQSFHFPEPYPGNRISAVIA